MDNQGTAHTWDLLGPSMLSLTLGQSREGHCKERKVLVVSWVLGTLTKRVGCRLVHMWWLYISCVPFLESQGQEFSDLIKY